MKKVIEITGKIDIAKTLKMEEESKSEKACINRKEFEEAVRPLIKWLCENYHPMATAIITPTSCELLESKCSTHNIYDYILD